MWKTIMYRKNNLRCSVFGKIVTGLFVIALLSVFYRHYYSTRTMVKVFQSQSNRQFQDVIPREMDILNKFLKNRKHDLLIMRPPTFLPQFKNPCFYEEGSGVGQHKRRLRCLPYFMVIGIEKCGTTNLFSSIGRHPDVVMPQEKELAFWANCRHCADDAVKSNKRCARCRANQKPITWSDYLDSFNDTAESLEPYINSDTAKIPNLITGDGSPASIYGHGWKYHTFDYLKDGEIPPLFVIHYIKHLLPNLKMIVTLRDPGKRMYSDYARACRRNEEKESPEKFHKIAIEELEVFEKCRKKYSLRYCTYKHPLTYLHRGIYVVYLKDWFNMFPREQFYISHVEHYATHKKEVVNEVYKFLGLRDVNVKLDLEYTPKHKKTFLNETQRLLQNFYKPFNEELAALLQDRKFAWEN